MLTSIRRSVFAKIACRHSILSIHRNAPVVEQLAGNVGKYKYRYHASSSSASASTTTTTAAAAAADEDGNNSNSEDDDATHHYQQPEEHRVCNEQYEGILTIVETPSKGLGLFASKDFETGELVMSSRPVKTTKERCSHSVQIDWDRHILMNVPCVLINHSCDANVGIRNNNNNNNTTNNTNTTNNNSNNNNKDGDAYAYDFLAIRPITQGEELTWDYEATEWEISVPFQCGCGSANCRGTLRGFKDSGTMIQQRYGDHYADYLKE